MRYTDWQGRHKAIVFANDMMTYEQSPKELISDYSKVARHKVDIQNSIAFLHTINKQVEFEIKHKIIFILAPPKDEYLGINLTKYIQGLTHFLKN